VRNSTVNEQQASWRVTSIALVPDEGFEDGSGALAAADRDRGYARRRRRVGVGGPEPRRSGSPSVRRAANTPWTNG
jgi:hypothetical protein